MANSNLVLHCGGRAVTREQAEAVPVPAWTHSYRVVSYAAAIDAVHNAARVMGREITAESYGLGRDGNHLFALITLAGESSEYGLSIGLRQSYDKSLSLGIAIGARVFVCDNLAFSGNSVRYVRKNTLNAYPDFMSVLHAQAGKANYHYQSLESDIAILKAIPCSIDRGYELLGLALGKGVLTTTQANVAFADWTTPRHEEFSDRNLWGWYNACTEGLKKGPTGNVIGRHVGLHDFVKNI